MTQLLERNLIFVTGKGGVGKTTVAAALALLGAQHGRRTLACELDAKGNLSDFFEAGPTTFRPREVQRGLFAMSMDTEQSLMEYLELHLHLPRMARMGPVARAFEFVSTAAPGVREILTVGKPVYEAHQGNYDLVVVDATATGHVLSQLAAPKAVRNLIQGGPVRDQTDWMLDMLTDRERTGVVIVSTPEEIPVTETMELAGRVEQETGVDLAAVIVNRVLPELFGRGEEAIFDQLTDPAWATTLSQAVRGPVQPMLDAARLAVALRRTRAAHLERLRKGIGAATPLLYVPYLFARAHGLRSTRQVAEALSAELGY